jgi:hypothetical protein
MTKRTWIGAAVLAAGSAAAAYFLDPDNGKARRIRVVEQSGHLVRMTGRRLARESRYASHTILARARHLVARERPEFADGRALLDRVESELFRDRSIPHGRLNLEVEGTTVVLRGQLDGGDDMFKVEEAVRKVPGVTAVRSLLHIPGTPAPNKADALAATNRPKRKAIPKNET